MKRKYLFMITLCLAMTATACAKPDPEYSVRTGYETETLTVSEALAAIDYDSPSDVTVLLKKDDFVLFESEASCGFDGEKILTVRSENLTFRSEGTAADLKAEVGERVSPLAAYYLYPAGRELLDLNPSSVKKVERTKTAGFTYYYTVTFQERAVREGMTMFSPLFGEIEDVTDVSAGVKSSPILVEIDGKMSCGGATPYELTFQLVYRVATRIVA